MWENKSRLSVLKYIGLEYFPRAAANKADLTRCAEDILLIREEYFPATIAELYEPDKMPGDLREAHERNDEVLERIYIGRRFKNDSERLERLFSLYAKMISVPTSPQKRKTGKNQ
jgi:hypothetical protein